MTYPPIFAPKSVKRRLLFGPMIFSKLSSNMIVFLETVGFQEMVSSVLCSTLWGVLSCNFCFCCIPIIKNSIKMLKMLKIDLYFYYKRKWRILSLMRFETAASCSIYTYFALYRQSSKVRRRFLFIYLSRINCKIKASKNPKVG